MRPAIEYKVPVRILNVETSSNKIFNRTDMKKLKKTIVVTVVIAMAHEIFGTPCWSCIWCRYQREGPKSTRKVAVGARIR